jgi:hypothetical protein
LGHGDDLDAPERLRGLLESEGRLHDTDLEFSLVG